MYQTSKGKAKTKIMLVMWRACCMPIKSNVTIFTVLPWARVISRIFDRVTWPQPGGKCGASSIPMAAAFV